MHPQIHEHQLWSTQPPLLNQRIKCEVIPDGATDLVFEIIGELTTPYIFGTATKLYQFKTQQNASYFGVRFAPGVLPLVDDYTPQDLVDQHLNLNHIPALNELGQRLIQTSEQNKKLKLLNNFFHETASFYGPKYLEPLVSHMVKSHGDSEFSSIFETAKRSTRQIEREFKKSLGLSPKKLCRILRFKRATELLKTNMDYAQVALECGYYDQSHMINDFKDLSHKSPGAFPKPSGGSHADI
jgi:AraC-like DNA-binding protein